MDWKNTKGNISPKSFTNQDKQNLFRLNHSTLLSSVLRPHSHQIWLWCWMLMLALFNELFKLRWKPRYGLCMMFRQSNLIQSLVSCCWECFSVKSHGHSVQFWSKFWELKIFIGFRFYSFFHLKVHQKVCAKHITK